MCGIAGIFGTERIPNSKDAVKLMLQRMNHRGPDAHGISAGQNVTLGHKRLSIIDISDASNQPFTSTDGRYTLVFNGEIYNYQNIRSTIPDYTFVTNSDTEVFIAAYAKWGTASFQLFNGMFSAALWDSKESKLVLVRDRLGIKPLYYFQNDYSLVFASEVRALLASGLVPRKLNESVLPEYLQYQCVHAPNTIIEGVKMLEPGRYIEVSDNTFEQKVYWMPWQNAHSEEDPLRIQKVVRDRFTAAVEKRLIADVPVGAFLSGGIDSSLITAVIADRLDKKVDTFNVSFDENEWSEAKYARLISKQYKTNHHEIMLKPSDFLESLPDALKDQDHPSGDGPNSWIVSKETKSQGITVALSGLGGDEVFAGYDVFRQIPDISEKAWLLSFPKFLRNWVGMLGEWKNPGIRSAKKREILTLGYFDLENLYPVFRKVLLDDQIKKIINNGSGGNRVASIVRELNRFSEFESLPVLSRIGIAEMYTYMQNVLLRDTDQMSMAHSLEVRVPFLDHELVEYLTYVPDQVKYPHTPKQLLTESFKDLLPPEVINRPKMGFVFPWENWMRNELSDFCIQNLSHLKNLSIFVGDEVDLLWKRFVKQDPSLSWSRIWPLVVLGHWLKENEIES